MNIIAPFLTVMLLPATLLANTSWIPPDIDSTTRPRILYRAGDEEGIRNRLTREPYKQLYRSIKGYADRAYDLSDHSVAAEQRKANGAKAAAFMYAMNRDVINGEVLPFATEGARKAYGDRAAELLRGMYTLSRMTDFSKTDEDLHTGQELQAYATAYDTLAGAGYTLTGSESEIRDNLADLAGDFYKDWTVDLWALMRGYNNNHRTKSAAALGVAAMVLSNYSRINDDAGYFSPHRWMEWAMFYMDRVMDICTDDDGGFVEGPSYYRYTAINHLSFMRALNLYLDGRGVNISGRHYPDFWTAPFMKKTQDWLLALRLPDGTMPAFDDNTPGIAYPFGLFSKFPNAPSYHWAWMNGRYPYDHSGSLNLTEEIICNHDDRITPSLPSGMPTRFLPKAGIAVFRNNWDDNGIYFLILAEHGKAAAYAITRDGEEIDGLGGHEHADPGAFMLHAFGEYLALDSGYLGWDNRNKVNHPRNHNIILVDGQGPKESWVRAPPFDIIDGQIVITDESIEGGWMPGGDGKAYLENYFTTGHFDYAEVATEYHLTAPETKIRRHVLFPRKRYIFLVDDIESEGSLITYLLHGNGGGSSGGSFSMLPGAGAQWRRSGASLDFRIATTAGSASITEGLEIHDAHRWREETHSFIKAEVSGPPLSFLSILYPRPASENEPTVEIDSSGQQAVIRISDADSTFTDIAATRRDSGNIAIDDTVLGQIKSDGTIIMVGRTGSMTDQIFIKGGTFISHNGRKMVETDAPSEFSLHLGPTAIEGHFRGAATWIDIVTPGTISAATGICGYQNQSGKVRIQLGQEGAFTLELTGQQRNARPIARPKAPATARIRDLLQLDGTPSCDADNDALTYSWRLVERPRGSTCAIIQASQPRAFVRPDKPGSYQVELVVSDHSASSRAATLLIEVRTDRGSPSGSGGCRQVRSTSPSAGPILLLLLLSLSRLRRKARSD